MTRILLILLLGALTACATFDPGELTVTEIDRETVSVLPGCDKFYDKTAKETVAVVEFINRTTYGETNVVGGGISSATIGGAASSGNTSAYAQASQTNFETISKTISPYLGEYAQSAVESNLVKNGGVDVIARVQMNALLKEQHFQTVMADYDTAVEFGRLIGSQYLITGSVDNINVVYKKESSMGEDIKGLFGTLLTAADFFNNMDAGWNVTTELTINMIDVATGRIVVTEKARGFANVGNSPSFSTDQVISGAKKAMGEAIHSSIKLFSSEFEVRGYVNEMRGGRKAALISIGKTDGLRKGDKLKPYELTSKIDFRTGKNECFLTALPFDLKVTEYIENNSAWAEVGTTDPKLLSRLKVGTIVRKSY